MLIKTFGAALHGVQAFPVTVEVSVGREVSQDMKTPGKYLVGLPDSAVKESIQRMEIAIKSIQLKIPRSKIVVNLAPADVKKSGTGFDLPVAIGILGASGQLHQPKKLMQYMLMGELALDGTLLPVKGALPMAILARQLKFKGILVPKENEREAAMVNDLEVYGMESLDDVVSFFCVEEHAAEPVRVNTREEFFKAQENAAEDFLDVKGQQGMKRAMEIAAAGGHNVIMVGPPGSSKTMLARRLPSILPPLSLHEALETTRVYSVSGLITNKGGLISQRPFRTPHHTISNVALVGGGSNVQPGEISLAHHGVLFLDELPEFQRAVLEVLRQPMEERKVIVARAKMTLEFPADFMLVASMNPCPCGYYNHPERRCTCSQAQVQRYLGKISGPLLDRIDLQLGVNPVPFYELDNAQSGESSAVIRARVISARNIQLKRSNCINALMTSRQVAELCVLDDSSRKLLHSRMDALQLSARAYERILKVCRTIADLEGSEKIKMQHVAEAIHYRSLDLTMSGKKQSSTEATVRNFVPFMHKISQA